MTAPADAASSGQGSVPLFDDLLGDASLLALSAVEIALVPTTAQLLLPDLRLLLAALLFIVFLLARRPHRR